LNSPKESNMLELVALRAWIIDRSMDGKTDTDDLIEHIDDIIKNDGGMWV